MDAATCLRVLAKHLPRQPREVVEGMRTKADVDALYGEFQADFADKDRKMHYVFMRAWGGD